MGSAAADARTGSQLSVLDALIVGRSASLFAPDLDAAHSKIVAAFRGARVLVIGGGGSIGAASIRLLLDYHPAAIHVVDLSENYLAELVRDLRSSAQRISVADFRTLPLDYGSGVMARLLAETKPYDVVLNFAALKHVRSEKDAYSVLQMLDTNLLKHARFKTWLRDYGHAARYFAVSTDKAANPTSIMGASKRLMEDVAFDFSRREDGSCTSARFANVAFSNGSLLQSFLTRIEKRQPLAAPRGTRRYFVARREASEICVLAAAAVPDRHLAIPALDPATHLQPLDEIATKLLTHFKYRAVVYDDEAAAIRDCETLAARGEWPLVVTSLDTSGEKPFEEFTGDDEAAIAIGFSALRGIRHADNPLIDGKFIATLGDFVEQWSAPIAKRDLAALLGSVLPTFCHVETGKNLDQRV